MTQRPFGFGVGPVRFDGEEFTLYLKDDEDYIVPADRLGK